MKRNMIFDTWSDIYRSAKLEAKNHNFHKLPSRGFRVNITALKGKTKQNLQITVLTSPYSQNSEFSAT